MSLRYLPRIYSNLLFKNLKREYPTVLLIPEGKDVWLAYYRGLKFHIRTPDVRLLRNISEPYERHFEVDGIMADVGASIGEQTLPYALKAKRVFALEPDEERVGYLSRNVQMNDLKNVDIIKKAARRNSEILRTEKGKVKAEPLRDLLPMKVDFLKIDVEGTELEVLEGADLSSVKNVVLEAHGTEQEVVKLLRGEGFKVLAENKYVYAQKLPGA